MEKLTKTKSDYTLRSAENKRQKWQNDKSNKINLELI